MGQKSGVKDRSKRVMKQVKDVLKQRKGKVSLCITKGTAMLSFPVPDMLEDGEYTLTMPVKMKPKIKKSKPAKDQTKKKRKQALQAKKKEGFIVNPKQDK